MYPKICTHRDNPHAQVVVASAEQEAALPEEYRSITGEGYIAPDSAILHDEVLAALSADRAQLDKDRLAFSDDLEKAKAELRAEREALDAERTEFAAMQASAESDSDAPAPPARRGRPPNSAANPGA